MNNNTSSAGFGPHRDPAKERFWRGVMRRFCAAAQDGRAFCKANNLSEASFYSWRRTIAQRDAEAADPRLARPAFVELRPQAPMPGVEGVPVEIIAGSRRVLIRPGCDRSLLREVLAAMEG